MTRRRNNNSLISIGGNSRGRRQGLLSTGIKYGAAYGIAREGFKAWGNHNDNNQQQQQQQQSYCPVQSVPQYVQHQMQMAAREPSQSPPPYISQLPEGGTTFEHQSWCSGQCNGQCSQGATKGEAAAYYNGKNF